MSRNPQKTRCQVPGCRNWAMRGHTHCRSHRDPELGPRGAGAPSGNLNALRTGHDAYPLSPDDLDQLVHAILHTPDQLPHHLDLAIQSIHRRCQDPVKTLAALRALVPALLSRVADSLFIAELHTFLEQLPPTRQSRFEISIWRQALRLSPVQKLELLRTLQRALAHKLQSPQAAPAPDASPPAPARDTRDSARRETTR